ncbi:MAG: cofactor-independent phosphoglycerate mutase, partial [Thermodesulfobacteriota bacterium]|nr:cofactor-independent phosphoglycerate mutase [Thermodesulfobacteriota bacterium]
IAADEKTIAYVKDRPQSPKGALWDQAVAAWQMGPGSDIANLSILGYDPNKYYTGRAPLEAASMGLHLDPEDVAFRCNLVTLSVRDGKKYMDDYSADHISTNEAEELIHEINLRLGNKDIEFHSGMSYRHIMVWKNGYEEMNTTPPHDISGKETAEYMPKGKGAGRIVQLMNDSKWILDRNPVNQKRIKEGKKPANSIWLWGHGRAPVMPTLIERHGISGSVISAVDLIKGIGIYLGLEVVDVPGATGYLDTNYQGKAEYALRELEKKDFVYLHVEAPDEAAHSGHLKDKMEAIERFDREVVRTVLEGIERFERYRIMVLPDHLTPLTVKTHTADPVPFVIYSSDHRNKTPNKDLRFDEKCAMTDQIYIENGHELLTFFLEMNV